MVVAASGLGGATSAKRGDTSIISATIRPTADEHQFPTRRRLVAQHEEGATSAPQQHQADQHQPVQWVLPEHAVVVAQHRDQHRQREVGVVHAALLAALAVHRVGLAAAARSATTMRWPGMIQKNTLALMIVASIAPASRKAARR